MKAVGLLDCTKSRVQAKLTETGIKNNTGPAENLFIDDIPKPTPSASEALVKIKAFGLNRMDLLQREGKYPVPPQAPPTMGVEFSGTVEEFGGAGGSDNGFKIGDEVLGLAYGGAYAEYIVVSLGMLVHKPKQLSWEEAAGVPEVSLPPPPHSQSTSTMSIERSMEHANTKSCGM